MIDWRELLFWQNTDMDTAGCLSERMTEWYMSIIAQNKAETAHSCKVILYPLPEWASNVSVFNHYLKHLKHGKRPLVTVDRIRALSSMLGKSLRWGYRMRPNPWRALHIASYFKCIKTSYFVEVCPNAMAQRGSWFQPGTEHELPWYKISHLFLPSF